ncbi:MAG: crotonase/enoyl-CoA hydratase family protein [Acidocella sp.]|nr:crotonase/enoyl-CoA hydratase family protein [Acidocella sp.]
MQYETILYDVRHGVLTITLNRPERLNAFTGTMSQELVAAFDAADADDNVRAVIVTGAGRAFCAGADLAGGAETFSRAAAEGQVPRDIAGLVALRIFRCLKPVIAAINGPAVGVGVTMTLPMDIRLASTEAKFGFAFTRRGIVPEAGSSWFLPRIAGISRAMEWCATGRVFGAAEATQGGLLREVHAPEALLPAATALAREIADNTAPVSVALTRQMLWQGLGQSHPMEAHRLESRALYARGKTADAAEGVTSFLEKRAPNYPDQISTGMPDFYPWRDEPEYF